MTSIDDCTHNLKVILNAIEKLPQETRLFCLPENSLYLNLDKSPIPREAAFNSDSPEIKTLQKKAKEKNIYIHLGGIPWMMNGEVFNEALLLTPEGEIKETYEKLHLFDVELGPGIEICESNSYRPGQRLNTFEVDGWKIATTICYDLRFPEIFLQYMQEEDVDLFLVPAAFTTKTGKIHWKPLLMARAIECQSFVLAPAQVGYHRDKSKEKLRKSWGQSLVIGPWGRVIEETDSFEDFLDSDLTEHPPINSLLRKSDMESYRKSIPIRQHRRYQWELKKNDEA
ncbi:MAG: hypothetical protein MJK18_12910 [Bdellovibrionales bacterium]|nr:hypothetical protein [Bdellovibrionales bacterium]